MEVDYKWWREKWSENVLGSNKKMGSGERMEMIDVNNRYGERKWLWLEDGDWIPIDLMWPCYIGSMMEEKYIGSLAAYR